MKVCSKCKENKSDDQFYIDKRFGCLRQPCKPCLRITSEIWRKTEKGMMSKRKSAMRYYNTPKGKKRAKKYRQDNKEHYARIAREYAKRPEIAAKIKERYDKNREKINEQHRGYIKKHYNKKGKKNKRQARWAVYYKVRKKELEHPNTFTCFFVGCKSQAELYHHWNYDKRFWFSVIPLCEIHHGVVHYKYI